jgi:hypothetical protein
MGVAALGNPPSRRSGLGRRAVEGIALDEHDLFESAAQGTSGQQPGHPSSDNDRSTISF